MSQQNADLSSGDLTDDVHEASKTAVRRWRRRIIAVGAASAVIAACVAIKMIGGRPEADAQSSKANRTAAKGASAPTGVRQTSGQTAAAAWPGMPVVAVVNGEEIQRQELAGECLAVYGKEVLESVMNKHLIMSYCQQRQINVTQKDVQDEIDRMARKFGLTTDQYLKMLKQERSIKPEQYASDIVWPMLALRRLAQGRDHAEQGRGAKGV